MTTFGFHDFSEGKLRIVVFLKQSGFLKDYLIVKPMFQGCVCGCARACTCARAHTEKLTHGCINKYGENGFMKSKSTGLPPLMAFVSVCSEGHWFHKMWKSFRIYINLRTAGLHQVKQVSLLWSCQAL